MRKTITSLTVLLALALVPSAQAAFGDNFGIAQINDGAGALQDAPAYPGDRAFWAGTCDLGSSAAAIGVPSAGPSHCIEWSPNVQCNDGSNCQVVAPKTVDPFLPSQPPAWRLAAVGAAGTHGDGTAAFSFTRNAEPGQNFVPDGTPDTLAVELPPGFLADPGAVPRCTSAQFAERPNQCPPASQVGIANIQLKGEIQAEPIDGGPSGTAYAVYNLEPRAGRVAELGIPSVAGFVNVRVEALVRTNSDFGATGFVTQIPAALPLYAQALTIWGNPWAPQHDKWRPVSFEPGDNGIPRFGGVPPARQAHYEPSWGPLRPFVSNITGCSGEEPQTRLLMDSFEHPGARTSEGDPDVSDADWRRYLSPAPVVTGCEKLPFSPSITLDPKKAGAAENAEADSPSGLDVELGIPQNNQLPFATPPDGAPAPEVEQYLTDAVNYWASDAGLATSHLRDTVVALPAGMTLNPAAASGQGACSMSEMGLISTSPIRFDKAPVTCPDAAKVAEVVVETPLLEEADWPAGEVYLAKQGANPFQSDFAIYIALRSAARGLTVKLAGEVSPDPATGRLTTTFEDNPPLPFDVFRLKFKAGPRAALATPPTCGEHVSESSFTSHASPNVPIAVADSFQITSSPAGGCAATKEQRPLHLGFSAGSTEILAGAHTPFTVRITRGDGNQELDRIEVTTPEGFAAKLAGIPSCPEAAIAQAIARTASGDGALEQQSPSCPESSKIATTTIGAGAGAQPFYVSGNVYLAGPYKGAPLSLAFIVPAIAGPFDLGVQVVRAAVKVDPVTAQITTVSDPIPQILRGVPLRLRDIRVDVDRGGFALNPTDCAEQLVSAKVSGSGGAVSELSNRFQVAECARLPFKPQISLQLFGGIARAKYQGVRATVRPRPGDANISGAVVRFPTSAFVAQEHLKNICTRVQWAAGACPPSSIYGTAEAISPLLDEPLKGNVHLRSSDNLLPDLVADLRGPASRPIRVEVAIKTDSVKGALRNTVQSAPDVPVSYFRLQTFGGKKGLIRNSRGICGNANAAKVTFDAHNGRRSVRSVPVRNARCAKRRKG